MRSGCTMTLWAAKATGVMFGGVTDEDQDEETMESVFHSDLSVMPLLIVVLQLFLKAGNVDLRNGYLISGKGRWVSLTLKKPKKKGGAGGKKKKPVPNLPDNEDNHEGSDEDSLVRDRRFCRERNLF